MSQQKMIWLKYRELTDNKIKELQIKEVQLNEKLRECDNQDYPINIGKRLKDVLNLKELTPQVLHSLIEKTTCNNDGTVKGVGLKPHSDMMNFW